MPETANGLNEAMVITALGHIFWWDVSFAWMSSLSAHQWRSQVTTINITFLHLGIRPYFILALFCPCLFYRSLWMWGIFNELLAAYILVSRNCLIKAILRWPILKSKSMQTLCKTCSEPVVFRQLQDAMTYKFNPHVPNAFILIITIDKHRSCVVLCSISWI